MNTYTPEQLKQILDAHAAWLRGEPQGARANLADADLAGADLAGADLVDADLAGADLAGAHLAGAKGLPSIITIPDIDAAVLKAVNTAGCRLDMSNWHTCETTHCRAGWIVTLAGEAGRVAETLLGTGTAAALIYAQSAPGQSIPNWFASDEEAMTDIRTRAEAARV